MDSKPSVDSVIRVIGVYVKMTRLERFAVL